MNIKRNVNIGYLLGTILLLINFYSNSIFPILFGFEVEILKYAILILISSVVIFSKGIRVLKYSIPIILASLMSILFNDIPSEFKPYFRFFAWLLLLISIGPLVRNSISTKIKEKVFYFFPKVCVAVTLISFFYWFINFQVVGRGFFTGIMRHAMLISPIASFALIYLFILFLKGSKKRMKIFYFFLMLLALTTCLLGASRSSLLGALIAITIIFYQYSKKWFWIIATVGILSSPIYIIYKSYQKEEEKKISYTRSDVNRDVLEGLSRKGSNNSRNELWEDRFNEFFANPIFGSGFASVDLAVIKGDKYIKEEGKIELGSGYLSILSMLGTLGVLAFMYFIIRIYKVIKDSAVIITDKTKHMLTMYFSFFGVHLIFEGYLFAVGSILGLLLWAILGFSLEIKNSEKALK